MLQRKLIFEVPDSHLFLGVLRAWMTFKKPEMDKTLRNELCMSETDPLNHKQLDFVIQSGLALHQSQKILLFKAFLNSALQFSICIIHYGKPQIISLKQNRLHQLDNYKQFFFTKKDYCNRQSSRSAQAIFKQWSGIHHAVIRYSSGSGQIIIRQRQANFLLTWK